MRTTITLDEEAAAAVAALRRDTGMGLSDAANTLIHRGAVKREQTYQVSNIHHSMGAKIPLDKTCEVLEYLDFLEGDRR